MNLKALRIFVAVMDRGTLTDAAKSVNLSQSAASRLLSLLEDEIAAQLFRREKRHLMPTEAAEAMYPEALRILAQISALPEVASGASAGSALRIICHSRLAGQLVVPAINRFVKAHPDQSIRLETAPRRELVRRVLAGRYDIAVAALPLSIGEFSPTRLTRARLGIVLHKDDPLAKRRVLSLSDLSDLNYIALDETTAVRRALEGAFEQSGRTVRPAHEVSTGTNAYRMVAAGLGYTFADPMALDPEIASDLALVPWDQDVRLDIGYFSMAQNQKSPVATFEQLLKDIATTM